MLCAKKYLSPLGVLIMVCDGQNLVGLHFENAPEHANKHAKKLAAQRENYVYGKMNDCEVFALTERWLDEYFCGRQPDFLPPLKICGTPFFQSVAQVLLQIPYGRTMTYGQIAAQVCQGKLCAQAVGGAVGGNPLCIVVPCHRVVGAKSLVGYGGGLSNKIALLKLEGADLSAFQTDNAD